MNADQSIKPCAMQSNSLKCGKSYMKLQQHYQNVNYLEVLMRLLFPMHDE